MRDFDEIGEHLDAHRAEFPRDATPPKFEVGQRLFDTVRGIDGTVVRVDAAGVWFWPDGGEHEAAVVPRAYATLAPLALSEAARLVLC